MTGERLAWGSYMCKISRRESWTARAQGTFGFAVRSWKISVMHAFDEYCMCNPASITSTRIRVTSHAVTLRQRQRDFAATSTWLRGDVDVTSWRPRRDFAALSTWFRGNIDVTSWQRRRVLRGNVDVTSRRFIVDTGLIQSDGIIIIPCQCTNL